MKQKQGIGSSIMQMMTNTAFKIDYMFSEEIRVNEKINILGQEIQNAELFQQLKQTLIWFCYRANIQYDGKAISDQGWGCMIRVGQMMLANALMRECQTKRIKEIKDVIISYFEDNQQYQFSAPFSIQQIIKKASENFQMKIGDWYTGPKIMNILEDLNAQAKIIKTMKVFNFVEQCIIESQLDLQFQTPQLLIVHAIIGDKQLTASGVQELQRYLKITQFAGAIVGKNNKAFFLIGFQEKNAIYMDPHYVKDSDIVQLDCNLKCQSIKSLTGTVALAYYISNYYEYQLFKKQVQEINGSIFSIIEPFEMNHF